MTSSHSEGRMVNISTENVLIEQNLITGGHGVAIGSETAGWVRDVVVQDLVLQNAEAVVRMKSMRGRGGGAERILYKRVSGNVVGQPDNSVTLHPSCRESAPP